MLIRRHLTLIAVILCVGLGAATAGEVESTDLQSLIVFARESTEDWLPVQHLFLTSEDGLTLRQLTSGRGKDYPIGRSSDGRLLAYHHYEDRQLSIHILDLVSEETLDIATRSGGLSHPSLSPSGQMLVGGEEVGYSVIEIVVYSTSTGDRRVLDAGQFHVEGFLWDASEAAVTCVLTWEIGNGYHSQFAKYDLNTGHKTVLGSVHGGFVGTYALSPDGTVIAYHRESNGEKNSMFLLDLQSGNTTELRSTWLPTSPRAADFPLLWYPDGRGIIFLREYLNGRDGCEFMVWLIEERRAELLLPLPGDWPYWGTGGLTLSPDGIRVAFSTSRKTHRLIAMGLDGSDVVEFGSGIAPVWAENVGQ